VRDERCDIPEKIERLRGERRKERETERQERQTERDILPSFSNY
jgi:hypothetical protein